MQPRVLVVVLLALVVGRTASADVITFNGVEAHNNDRVFGRLVVDGFEFTSPHAHVTTSPERCAPACADNGTPWIGGDTSEVTMSRQDGGRFSLASFDAAEAFSSGLEHPIQIVLSGALDGSEGLMMSFSFDGVNDGLGPLADFQTFIPDSQWDGLLRVTFRGVGRTGGWFGLDNLVVDAAPVPEPGTLLLFGTAVGFAAFRAARSQKADRRTRVKSGQGHKGDR